MNFKTISQPDDPDFIEALALYQEAFPPQERQSREALGTRIISSKGRFIVAQDLGKVVAMSILWKLSNVPFTLLEYFAVHQNHRGSGLGSVFLKYLKEISHQENHSLIAEVEDPIFGNNQHQRQNRLQFYAQNGFFQLGKIQSYVPALNQGKNTEVLLLISPVSKNKTFSRKIVSGFIQSLFSEIYQLPPNHFLVQKIIKRLPSSIPLLEI